MLILNIDVCGVHAGPHYWIHMLGNSTLTVVRVLVRNRSQNKDFTLNPMQAPLSLYLRIAGTFKYKKKSWIYFTLVISVCTAPYNKHFPFDLLDLLETYLSNPKMPCTNQGKACGCGKLPHDTWRVFLWMWACESACASVNTPSLFMCEHRVLDKLAVTADNCLLLGEAPHWNNMAPFSCHAKYPNTLQMYLAVYT